MPEPQREAYERRRKEAEDIRKELAEIDAREDNRHETMEKLRELRQRSQLLSLGRWCKKLRLALVWQLQEKEKDPFPKRFPCRMRSCGRILGVGDENGSFARR